MNTPTLNPDGEYVCEHGTAALRQQDTTNQKEDY